MYIIIHWQIMPLEIDCLCELLCIMNRERLSEAEKTGEWENQNRASLPSACRRVKKLVSKMIQSYFCIFCSGNHNGTPTRPPGGTPEARRKPREPHARFRNYKPHALLPVRNPGTHFAAHKPAPHCAGRKKGTDTAECTPDQDIGCAVQLGFPDPIRF